MTNLQNAISKKTALKPFIGWIFLFLWLLILMVSLVNPELGQSMSKGTILVDMIFAILLGVIFLGVKDTLIFYLITFLGVIIMENLSIAYGFPFGFFQHLLPGPRIINVPIAIALGYFNFAMISWVMADLILGHDSRQSRWIGILGRPLLGMVIASAMEVLYDPIGCLVEKMYQYSNGGGYFGVPLSNSFGWLLTVFIMLFLLELLRNRKSNNAIISDKPVSSWHLQTSILIGMHVLTPLVAFFTTQNTVLKDVTGKTWYSSDLYETVSLVGLHTVVFFMIVGIFSYLRRRKEILQA